MSPPGDEAGRRPDNPEATPASTSPEVGTNLAAVLIDPTLLEICAYIERSTGRILAMADNIEATADFCESTWRDEMSTAIRRASDRAIVERLWAAA